MRSLRSRTWWSFSALAATAALSACLTFTRVSVHGDPARPTFEPEGDVHCGAGHLLIVSEVASGSGSGSRRLWALQRTAEIRRVTRLQYGEVPPGWRPAAEWLPSSTAPTPLAPGTLYSVELECGRDRAFGVFELVTYAGGLRVRNLDREEFSRRVAGSPAGSSPVHR